MTVENVFYSVREKDELDSTTGQDATIDIDALMAEINNGIDCSIGHSDEEDVRMDILMVELSTNYSVQGLSRIMEYYGLSRKKLRKAEMIQIIIMYEDDPINLDIVERRRHLWKNLEELAQDPYLSGYVSF
jgi:hypothetical protein